MTKFEHEEKCMHTDGITKVSMEFEFSSLEDLLDHFIRFCLSCGFSEKGIEDYLRAWANAVSLEIGEEEVNDGR